MHKRYVIKKKEKEKNKQEEKKKWMGKNRMFNK